MFFFNDCILKRLLRKQIVQKKVHRAWRLACQVLCTKDYVKCFSIHRSLLNVSGENKRFYYPLIVLQYYPRTLAF